MKRRRAILVFSVSTILLTLIGVTLPAEIKQSFANLPQSLSQQEVVPANQPPTTQGGNTAQAALETLEIKGRAPKTGYERAEFGDGWAKINGCTTREIILYRDLTDVRLDGECRVVSGVLDDPYTGAVINFSIEDASAVQIDHVVALSDAWQKGAQRLSKEVRTKLANDPLELLAVDGPANQQKSDGDAATWLPKHKAFRCEYVARQIAVKKKYTLWVTQAEYDAMASVLRACPGQLLP